ncbi:MAG: hypothetical protein M5R40_21390 [Anaerolineae bacterium]|nr:hypothetical protein [Anaerolineae bacterium]
MPGFLLVVIGLWALLAIASDAPPALWQVAGLLAVTLGVSFIARFHLRARRAGPDLPRHGRDAGRRRRGRRVVLPWPRRPRCRRCGRLAWWWSAWR